MSGWRKRRRVDSSLESLHECGLGAAPQPRPHPHGAWPLAAPRHHSQDAASDSATDCDASTGHPDDGDNEATDDGGILGEAAGEEEDVGALARRLTGMVFRLCVGVPRAAFSTTTAPLLLGATGRGEVAACAGFEVVERLAAATDLSAAVGDGATVPRAVGPLLAHLPLLLVGRRWPLVRTWLTPVVALHRRLADDPALAGAATAVHGPLQTFLFALLARLLLVANEGVTAEDWAAVDEYQATCAELARLAEWVALSHPALTPALSLALAHQLTAFWQAHTAPCDDVGPPPPPAPSPAPANPAAAVGCASADAVYYVLRLLDNLMGGSPPEALGDCRGALLRTVAGPCAAALACPSEADPLEPLAPAGPIPYAIVAYTSALLAACRMAEGPAGA